MNQILVTEKLYVTPELKRKKKIYKINFIISIIMIVILCSFYAHAEYAKNREQEISQEMLSEMIQNQEEITAAEREIAKQDEGVWKIMMLSAIQHQNSTQQKTTVKKRTTTITASNGKRYQSLGRIQIPKIDVDYVILDKPSSEEKMVESLKISPCKFWGSDPNQVGNLSIAGHNYRNTKFFSKVPDLVNGDKIKIIDIEGKIFTYSVFDKYIVEPEDTSCINDIEGKENKRIVTLITCTNDGKKRVIIHAEEI